MKIVHEHENFETDYILLLPTIQLFQGGDPIRSGTCLGDRDHTIHTKIIVETLFPGPGGAPPGKVPED